MRLKSCCLVPAGALAVAALVSAPAAAHTRITTDLNFGEDVRPILRKHCMGCHSPGGMAPNYIDLTTYGSDRSPGARAWATAIEEEILTGRMPPWSADPRFDHYSNTRLMTQEEVDIIIGWVQGGAPQGPRRNLPPPAGFDGESWQLGAPDIVLEAPEAFLLPSGKVEDSTRFIVDPGIAEDGWITGFEFKPQNAGTVYRMAAWIHDPPGATPESLEVEIQVPYDPFRDEDEPEPSRMRPLRLGPHFLGQWLRGDSPVLFPVEMGLRLRKGSTFEIRVEYRRRAMDGYDSEVSDRSKLGLFLSQEVDEVDLILETESFGEEKLRLKGKKASRPVEASVRLAEDTRLVGLSPNVGSLLSTLEVRAIYPDDLTEILLFISDYDPEWPASFQFAEPIHAPAGTRVEMVGTFELADPKVEALQSFEMQLVYAANDHLVLPEPTTVRKKPQSSGGMLIGGAFGEGGDIPPSGLATGQPIDPRAAAHMDHSPLHGGQFFMAANQYHHVEGALPTPGEFHLYFYDDFKKPIDPRNFAGRVVFEEWDTEKKEWLETSYPLTLGEPGTESLRADIPKQLPGEFFAAVWLAGEEGRYDFYFEELSKEPDAVTLAKYAALGGHSHERPPLLIPDTAAEIVAGIDARTRVLEQLIEGEEWLALHIPALECRDLAEALLERLDGLSARDAGLARQAGSRVMSSAYDLDRAGDLADAGRATVVFDRFRRAVGTIDGLFRE